MSFSSTFIPLTTIVNVDFPPFSPAIVDTIADGGTQYIGSVDMPTGNARIARECIWWSDCICPGGGDSGGGTDSPGSNPVWPPGSDLVTQNLVMYREKTYIFDAQVLLRGSPVNLGSGTLTMTAKYAVTKETAVFTKDSSGNGITITDAANGMFTVTIDPEDTADLGYAVYYLPYDIQLTSGDNVYTVGYGILKVVPNVTRD